MIPVGMAVHFARLSTVAILLLYLFCRYTY